MLPFFTLLTFFLYKFTSLRYPWECIYEMSERTETYGLVIGMSCTPQPLKRRNKRAGLKKLKSLIAQKKECWHNKEYSETTAFIATQLWLNPRAGSSCLIDEPRGPLKKKKWGGGFGDTELTKNKWKSYTKWEAIKSNLKLYIHYTFYTSAVSFRQT